MKEIALLGTTGHVFGDVLGTLLARGLSVNAMVDFPEKVMVEDTCLTITHLPVEDTVHAAREAGVARVIVVGSPMSTAYFVTDLRRLDDIDWVFVSTENDYPDRVADEIIKPTFHREEYKEA